MRYEVCPRRYVLLVYLLMIFQLEKVHPLSRECKYTSFLHTHKSWNIYLTKQALDKKLSQKDTKDTALGTASLSYPYCNLNNFESFEQFWMILNDFEVFEQLWTKESIIVRRAWSLLNNAGWQSASLLNNMVRTRWTMPSSNWDTETQRWQHERNIEQLYLQLADRSET